jgi:hypothetical protein
LRRNTLPAQVPAPTLKTRRPLPPLTFPQQAIPLPRRRHLRLRLTRLPPRRRTILRRNKTILPPMSIWTRGLNRILRLLMSIWTQEPSQKPLTPARPPAALGQLKMPAQATRAPAWTSKERALQYQKSRPSRNLFLLAKLHRPRRNNLRPRLLLRPRPLPRPRLLPQPRPLSQPRPLFRIRPALLSSSGFSSPGHSLL